MNLDIMVDLETYGVGTKAAIAQIAAVPFDRVKGGLLSRNVEFETFNSYISLKANEDVGLQADESTMEWWSKQSADAYRQVITTAQASPHSMANSLTAFAHYLTYLRDVHKVGNFRIWGNGSIFDNRILMTAYEAAGVKLPWKYNEDRDLRTLVDIGEGIGLKPKSLVFQGIQHDALDDCRHQIRQAQMVFEAFEPSNAW